MVEDQRCCETVGLGSGGGVIEMVVVGVDGEGVVVGPDVPVYGCDPIFVLVGRWME